MGRMMTFLLLMLGAFILGGIAVLAFLGFFYDWLKPTAVWDRLFNGEP